MRLPGCCQVDTGEHSQDERARLAHLSVAPQTYPPRSCAPTGGTGGSAVQVIVPIAPGTGHPVGNGVYSLAIDLFSLGLSYRFGAPY